jgi:hypothetical protein
MRNAIATRKIYKGVTTLLPYDFGTQLLGKTQAFFQATKSSGGIVRPACRFDVNSVPV